MKNALCFVKQRSDDQVLWESLVDGTTLSLAQILELSAQYAYQFQALGVGPGDRVCLALDNNMTYVSAIIGIWMLGGVIVPIRVSNKTGDYYAAFVQRIDDICDVKMILTETNSDLEHEKRVNISYINLTQNAVVEAQFYAYQPDDLMLIQFSSGSTGHPKGVMITAKLINNQMQWVSGYHRQFRNNYPAINASWLPIHHDMGLFIGVVHPLHIRCTNYLASPKYYLRNTLAWFRLLSEKQVTFNFTTSSVLGKSLPLFNVFASQVKDLDFSRLCFIVSAEKINPNVMRRAWSVLSRYKLRPDMLKAAYGMAENVIGASVNTGGFKINRFLLKDGRAILAKAEEEGVDLVSLGSMIEGEFVRIMNDKSEILPENQIGEICLKTACITSGYYNNPEATALHIKSGWLHTRDIGFLHEGEIYFISRNDDIIVIGGRNIVPEDIEDYLEFQPSLGLKRALLFLDPSDANGTIHQNTLHLAYESKVPLNSDELRAKILNDCDVSIQKITHIPSCSILMTSSGKKCRGATVKKLATGGLL